jgi:hypothetical protein
MTRPIDFLAIHGARFALALSTILAFVQSGCGDHGGRSTGAASRYVLASVVIDPDGNRTTYVQTIESLEAGPFTNDSAIELPGNGVVMAHGQSFYVGLSEEPTWVRYEASENGIRQTGRLSLLNTGAAGIDFGNVVIDDEMAVSVFSSPPLAVVWNPTTMEIRGEVDLSSLARDGYELEVWTTAAQDGLVYVPGRWADWEGGRIYPGVSLTIIDPKELKILATAQDERCASGGRAVFDEAGYAYVMGDGRNYSIQMFAHANGQPVPENCLLRIPPGGTDFETDYFYTISSLTAGLESITELETARQGSGLAFAKMFYPDKLSASVKPVDFDFWGERAHKLWRLHLADPPSAEEVEGVPFSTIGFSGSVVGGRLYTGESQDGNSSDVYETDPDTNTARLKFTMDGYFNGLYERSAP